MRQLYSLFAAGCIAADHIVRWPCAQGSVEPEKPSPRLRCLGNPPGDEINSPVIRVYDEAGNVIETHEHKGEFKRAVSDCLSLRTCPVAVGCKG
jgi:hypothetical protein